MFKVRLRDDFELRQLEETDAPAAFAAVDTDRTHLREWLAWVDATTTPEDSLSFVRACVEAAREDRSITAGIWIQGELAGIVGTHPFDWLNRKVEIGYWLGRRFQGHGIMTQACRALVRHLFEDRHLHRIECLCATGNSRSCAIPIRLGFKHEATLREALLLDGKYHDVHLWAVLRREWKT
jgi:ribosomal-protein-serine acetyltransferase